MHDEDEEWIYIGTRADHKGKQYYAWLDKDGEEHLFSKLRGSFIGGIYTVCVWRREGGLSVSPNPTFVRTSDDKRIPEWESQHVTAQTMLGAVARERRAKREDAGIGDLTLKELAFEMKKMHTMPRRNALLASIIGYLTSTRVSDFEQRD